MQSKRCLPTCSRKRHWKHGEHYFIHSESLSALPTYCFTTTSLVERGEVNVPWYPLPHRHCRAQSLHPVQSVYPSSPSVSPPIQTAAGTDHLHTYSVTLPK
uniref:Uncharacterized protein n=1 Tax=Oncorhynchus mykiss TaxID=8022 RepID=A0A8C7VM73_ONCMY